MRGILEILFFAGIGELGNWFDAFRSGALLLTTSSDEIRQARGSEIGFRRETSTFARMGKMDTTGKIKVVVFVALFVLQLAFAPDKRMPDNDIPLAPGIFLPFLLSFFLAFINLRRVPAAQWSVSHWNENPFGRDNWIARYVTYGCFFLASGAGMTLGLLLRTGQLWIIGVMCCFFGFGFLAAIAAGKYRNAKRS